VNQTSIRGGSLDSVVHTTMSDAAVSPFGATHLIE